MKEEQLQFCFQPWDWKYIYIFFFFAETVGHARSGPATGAPNEKIDSTNENNNAMILLEPYVTIIT